MRIVIDLQSVQAPGYKDRGIGRSSLSLALGLAKHSGDHEILLALNGAFPDSIASIREKFRALIPPENIKIWHGLTPTDALNSKNRWRRKASELLREEFLASLQPDMVLICNLFQGFSDGSVVTIGAYRSDLPTAVLSHDLIPLIYPQQYLKNESECLWYHSQLNHLRRADLVLGVSESARAEILKYARLDTVPSCNISSAVNLEFFCSRPVRAEDATKFKSRYRLDRDFILYTGAEDARKNLDGLIRAYSLLDRTSQKNFQMVIACLSG